MKIDGFEYVPDSDSEILAMIVGRIEAVAKYLEKKGSYADSEIVAAMLGVELPKEDDEDAKDDSADGDSKLD